MSEFIFDNYSSFCAPAALPCFVDNERKADVWCDGYQVRSQGYDGFRNWVEIQPLVKASPEFIGGPYVPMGQTYMIGHRELSVRVLEGVRRAA